MNSSTSSNSPLQRGRTKYTLRGFSSNKVIRQHLKRNLTRPKQLLWFKLRNNQLGYKYRRQHGIGAYVLDFYCPALHFGIEVDGLTHEESHQIHSDAQRIQFLNNLDVTIIRFTNRQIMNTLNEVLEVIVVTQTKLASK